MEIIEIVNPPLDEYAARANSIAKRYGQDSILTLREEEILSEEDRNEFRFIMKAVGDELFRREWDAFANIRPPQINLSASVEPEIISGSTVLGIDVVLGAAI